MSRSFDNDLNDNRSVFPGSSEHDHDMKIHIFPRRKVRISEDASPGGGGGHHGSLTGSMTSLREKLRHPMRQTSIETRQQLRKMVRRGKVGTTPEDLAINSPGYGTRNNIFATNASGVAADALPSTPNADSTRRASQSHGDELEGMYSKEELAEYHQLFSIFDSDGSGAIGSDELKKAIMSLGLQFNDVEIDTLIKEVDEDGNGEIDFKEFCHCMKKSQNLAKISNEEVARQCFEIFDQDGNGMITMNEFKYVAKEIGGFSDELAEHVFHELDISDAGHLSADQFGAIVEDYLLRDHHNRM